MQRLIYIKCVLAMLLRLFLKPTNSIEHLVQDTSRIWLLLALSPQLLLNYF